MPKILKVVDIPQTKGIQIECNCGNIWTYRGESDRFASCSKCRSTIITSKKEGQGGSSLILSDSKKTDNSALSE